VPSRQAPATPPAPQRWYGHCVFCPGWFWFPFFSCWAVLDYIPAPTAPLYSKHGDARFLVSFPSRCFSFFFCGRLFWSFLRRWKQSTFFIAHRFPDSPSLFTCMTPLWIFSGVLETIPASAPSFFLQLRLPSSGGVCFQMLLPKPVVRSKATGAEVSPSRLKPDTAIARFPLGSTDNQNRPFFSRTSDLPGGDQSGTLGAPCLLSGLSLCAVHPFPPFCSKRK